MFSPHVSFGGYLGYANLKGKDGRAHNVLPYVAGRVHDRARSAASASRSASPPATCRATARSCASPTGFAFALTPALDLVTELLAPMLWVTSDQMVLSMNLAAELVYRF